jgi:alpha-L-rhamnosidase
MEFSDGAKAAYNYHFVKENDINTIRQGKLVRPLALGLIEGETKKKVAKRLADVAVKRDYKIGTGFLSTPFILPVLVENGYPEVAYKVLKNTKEPGWLAMVEQGATTVWEHYKGYDEKGHPCDTSYNHYSPGAVCSFLFTHVAGIRIKDENTFEIKPVPGGSLTYARAYWRSIYGEIESSWEKENGKIIFRISVPSNCKADVHLTDGTIRNVEAGQYEFEQAQH